MATQTQTQTQFQTQTQTQTQSHLPSPTSSSSSSSNNNNNNNIHNGINYHPSPSPSPSHGHSHPPPLPSPRTPKPYPNPNPTQSPSSPYPTTFVQADSSSFKHVVQMLTGSEPLSPNPNPTKPSNPNTKPSNPSKPCNPIPPIKTPHKSKLYERRNSLKHLNLHPLGPIYGSGFGSSPRTLSPSILDFPALALSPVTPLIPDPFNRPPELPVDKAAEEKAIAEKGFFLHPSPVTTPRDSEPRLLPLFPVTSPRVASGSHPSSSN